MRGRWHGLGWLAALALAGCFPLAGAAQTKNSCVDCHSLLDPPLKVTSEQFGQDIHAQKGLTCAACHGGDPTKEGDDAMSKAAGFRGKPTRKEIPELCGKCHSDGSYMRQYNPSLRTDELAQYRTSQHGKLLATGDEKVAVCIDCHGVHNLRPASDPRSTVHPLNVANTCSRCHSDRERMASYKIPTDQFANYSASVHHEAQAVRGDLSAPTCTTCHGNHGAAPPGVSSVVNVCSTCHVFQAQLFDGSPHKAAFAAASMPGCVTCHSNHRIAHPSDTMIGTGTQAVCTSCHTSGDAGFTAAGGMHDRIAALESAIGRSEEILDRAQDAGVEVSQSKLELDQARDALTKARVNIHGFDAAKLEAGLKPGLAVTEKTYLAGQKALQESKFRRTGLSVSLLTILAVMAGLAFFIRDLEGRGRL